MACWLRHTTLGVTTSQRVKELILDEKDNVTRKLGNSLRGNTYDHKLSKRRKWIVVVSADETYGSTNAIKDFLKAFFAGDERFINLSTSGTEPVIGWVAVAMEGGDIPLSYIEDCIQLPEFSFTLIEKAAS